MLTDSFNWIISVRTLLTDDNPEIQVSRVLEIFDACSPEMDTLNAAYRAGNTPEQAYVLLVKRHGKATRV